LRTNPSQEGEDDQDLISSSHSSTKVADPSVQSGNTSIAYKGPLTRAHAQEFQTKVKLFLSTLNYEINENNLLPNGCTLLVLSFDGLTSLEDEERVAGWNLCLTAHVHDDGIMREEREAGSRCQDAHPPRGATYFSCSTRTQGDRGVQDMDVTSRFGFISVQPDIRGRKIP
ncbi:hypothetical protein EJB05_44724, partial [Eragrostis curvula]